MAVAAALILLNLLNLLIFAAFGLDKRSPGPSGGGYRRRGS